MAAATASAGWDAALKKAKGLESRLDRRVHKYSVLAQRINADLLCGDEESPLLESREEHELSSEIERDLQQLSECISRMKDVVDRYPEEHHRALLKRYQDILVDYSTEFQSTTSSIQRKRETAELLASSRTPGSGGKDGGAGAGDGDLAHLAAERSSLVASLRSINDILSQAFASRESLDRQRQSLNMSQGRIGALAAGMPSIDRIVEGLQRRKTRDNVILALVISLCLCCTIWWFVLRD